MKNVLITGISGFVGQHLATSLLQHESNEIVGTYHANASTLETNDHLKLVKIDLQDADAVSGLILKSKPDIIYHLAAQSSPANSFGSPDKTLANNIFSELHILETLKNNDMKQVRMLIVSTSEVYGMVGKADLPVDELTPLRPISPYAVSKIAQDFLGLQYSLSYKLDIIRVRPFNHIGPGQSSRFIASDFAKQIAEIEKGLKEPIIRVGNLQSRKDFTDVRDVIRAYMLLADKGNTGEVYNVGQGKSHEAKELLDTLLSFAKVKIKVEVDPAKFRPIDIPEVICDCGKLKQTTGWEPEIPFKQTLQDTLDYWRKLV